MKVCFPSVWRSRGLDVSACHRLLQVDKWWNTVLNTIRHNGRCLFSGIWTLWWHKCSRPYVVSALAMSACGYPLVTVTDCAVEVKIHFTLYSRICLVLGFNQLEMQRSFSAPCVTLYFIVTRIPFYYHGLTLIAAWISKYTHSIV